VSNPMRHRDGDGGEGAPLTDGSARFRDSGARNPSTANAYAASASSSWSHALQWV
jgi:hypothetical protein